MSFFRRWQATIARSYWLRSGAFALMQRLSVSACSVATFLLLVRMLSKESQGNYDLFMVAVTVFELFKTALLKNATLTLTYNQTEQMRHIQSASLLINLLLTAVVALLIVGAYGFWGGELPQMLAVYLPALLLLVAVNHFEIQMLVQADFRAIFFTQLARHSVIMLCVAGLFAADYPLRLWELALVQSLGVAAAALVGWRLARPLLLPFSGEQLRQSTLQLLRFGRYVAGTAIMADLARSADRYLVAHMAGTAATALYGISGRITNLTDLPASAVAEISFPKTVRAMAEEGKASVARVFEWSVAANWVFLLPASLAIMFVPEFVLGIVAGESYTEAAVILRLMLATGLLLPFMRQFGNTMDAIGKPHLNFRINAAIAVFCIGAELLLLPLAGKEGAAMGLFVGMFTGCALAYFVLRRYVPVRLAGILGKVFGIYRRAVFYLAPKKNNAHE